MRALLIEDDENVARSIELMLKSESVVSYTTDTGEEGVDLAKLYDYDVILLDLNLPDMSGYDVLRAIRLAKITTPILILSGLAGIDDKVKGLVSGADDYVTKPFHMEELLARVRALLRRAAGHATSQIACGPVVLDTRSGRVFVDGNPVKLTSHEYRLLSYLMHHTGRVVSRAELTEHLYDQDFDRDSNTIEVFVGRLRKKLAVDLIQTVRGLGYLVDPTQPPPRV